MQLGAGATIEAHLDRRAAIEGCDHVINMVQVGGHAATLLDFEIPKRFGLRQTIGDTLGIGGIFRALRTIPVMLDIARRHGRALPGRVAAQLHEPDGHAVLGDLRRLADPPGRRAVPLGAVDDARPGRARRRAVRGGRRTSARASTTRPGSCGSRTTARDLYPLLDEAIEGDPELRRRVRVEMYRRLGYFPTESSEHSAEYLPWFMRSDEMIERFRVPVDEYVRRSEENLERVRVDAAARWPPGGPFEIERSLEYASLIVHSIATGRAERVIYGNVPQRRPDLEPARTAPASRCPAWSTETACSRPPSGALPPQLAALNRTFLNVCELTVRAALEGEPRARRTTPPCSTPTRRPRSRRRRSTRWSTR